MTERARGCLSHLERRWSIDPPDLHSTLSVMLQSGIVSKNASIGPCVGDVC